MIQHAAQHRHDLVAPCPAANGPLTLTSSKANLDRGRLYWELQKRYLTIVINRERDDWLHYRNSWLEYAAYARKFPRAYLPRPVEQNLEVLKQGKNRIKKFRDQLARIEREIAKRKADLPADRKQEKRAAHDHDMNRRHEAVELEMEGITLEDVL
jgi:hypothetical protein